MDSCLACEMDYGVVVVMLHAVVDRSQGVHRVGRMDGARSLATCCQPARSLGHIEG